MVLELINERTRHQADLTHFTRTQLLQKSEFRTLSSLLMQEPKLSEN